MSSGRQGRIVALSGGVGGARFAHGIAQVIPPEELTVIVNTADDFDHLGLNISPDIDTVMYTLAGCVNAETGWGRRDETWSFMAATEALGGETWFRLGDRDLAVHVERTRWLRAGETLSDVTRHLTRAFGVASEILPMCDEPVATIVETSEGSLAFQEYFVARQCRPQLISYRFKGAEGAWLRPEVAARIATARVILLGPSNPFVSIAPILAVPGLLDALKARRVPLVAVSPIIGGEAIKGPAAKMMRELGLECSSAGVAEFYGDLLDGFVIDNADARLAGSIAASRLLIADTVMAAEGAAARLAKDVLAFACRLAE